MNTQRSSTANSAPAQGPISGDLQQYARRLSELACNLPEGDILEARRMIQGIFDGIDRVVGLENAAVLIGAAQVAARPAFMPHVTDGVRRCRVCGCTDDHACPGGCWWVSSDLCSACADAATEERQ